MYIDYIEIENFRTFRKSRISFCHGDQDFRAIGMPKPQLPNLNVLLANNGYGKTSLLKAIALAALGPAVGHSGIYPYHLIRRETGQKLVTRAVLNAGFKTHEQDHVRFEQIDSRVEVIRQGDIELLEWTHREPKAWQPVFTSNSDAFFMVGYGATRWVSKATKMEQSGRSSPRAARVMGLFEEDYSLRPLNTWLPRYKDGVGLRGRYVQVANLLNRLVGKGGWGFTGKQDKETSEVSCQGQSHKKFTGYSQPATYAAGWRRTLGGSA
jgi:hypothetical protein